MLKRDIYEFDTASAPKKRTEQDLHTPNRVNANTVSKTLTVYVRQACLSLQGIASFAEEAVLPKVFCGS